jgi:hypothetical protein
MARLGMQYSNLRIALYSGNYNYVRDGANQALNRLAGYLPADRRPCRRAGGGFSRSS